MDVNLFVFGVLRRSYEKGMPNERYSYTRHDLFSLVITNNHFVSNNNPSNKQNNKNNNNNISNNIKLMKTCGANTHTHKREKTMEKQTEWA